VTTQAHNFDPEQFLRLAERLVRSSDEAELRSAVSRAYYACFLQARAHLATSRFVQTGSSGDHRLVAAALEDIGAGTELGWLRTARNRADYRLDLPTQARNARYIVRRARQLFSRV
jgi:uncharacterized protein (UPF0332 family)